MGRIKIFLDTANIEQIRKAADWGMLDGVTTNPTLVAKEGRNYNEVLKEICRITDGPVSAETVGEDAEGIIKEGLAYSKIAKNIIIKVIMTPEGMKAVREFSKRGIKTNVTTLFSANQALLAAKAGATYVSPFIGRLDDIGNEGMQVVRDILQIYRNYDYKTQVLVASIRHPMHVLEAAKLGAHVATMPFEVLEKLFKHSLTDKAIKTFAEDYKKIPK